jgi:ribosomal protein L16 Arg81 hydroxylase
MTQSIAHLADLLRPIEVTAFFRDHWEKQLLHISRGVSGYYAGLPSLTEIDQLLHHTRPHFRVTGPPVIPTPLEVGKGGLADPIDLAQLGQVFDRGRTIVVDYVQNHHTATARLCHTLAMELQHPVNANLYVTPPHSQGFEPHFDGHDVFILQLEGRKRWQLYKEGPVLPLKGSGPLPRDGLVLSREIQLEVGDLLYLPRGQIHAAVTSEESSLHMTVGLSILRWKDLLRHAVEELAQRDVRFREALPHRHLDEAEANLLLQERFQELLGVLREQASYQGASHGLTGELCDRYPLLPDGRFTRVQTAPQVDLDTVLEKVTICRVLVSDHAADIQFPGNHVSGPRWIAPALEFIARATRFTARNLPSPLSDDAKLVLTRRLYRAGLLQIAEARTL